VLSLSKELFQYQENFNKNSFVKDAEILQIKISSAAGRPISEASPTGSGGKKI
jgi:hypothetical protein